MNYVEFTYFVQGTVLAIACDCVGDGDWLGTVGFVALAAYASYQRACINAEERDRNA